jgi:hypothetical protein
MLNDKYSEEKCSSYKETKKCLYVEEDSKDEGKI